MMIKRFYCNDLAHASYMVACQKSGEAIIIDPNRDTDSYVEAAADEGLRIVAVTETHIHADFLSGARELAQKTGATLYLSNEGDSDWKYGFADEPNVKLVRNGFKINVGNVRLQVVHTPGHTPEHISFLLTDFAASPAPHSVFSGDFLFVGDVGRPDLLERAAHVEGTMVPSAQHLFQSLRWLHQQPDYLLVWPAHGAGSACGKALGAVPVTSLGYERTANWALQINDEDTFVDQVLSGQPDAPRYFATMKHLNKMGPPPLGGLPQPAQLAPDSVAKTIDCGVVIDLADFETVANCGIRGALNLRLDKSLVTWAGWLIKYEQDILLLAESQDQANRAAKMLALIGLDRVIGWVDRASAIADAQARGCTTQSEDVQLESFESALRAGEITAVDVRSTLEYDEGHVPGTVNIPLQDLPDRLSELPEDKPCVVFCAGGTRSPIAVSIVQSLRACPVKNLSAGFMDYEAAGFPVEAAHSDFREASTVR